MSKCINSRGCRRCLLTAVFVVAVLGSTVYGQIPLYKGNQYGFYPVPSPATVLSENVPCPFCQWYCTCPLPDSTSDAVAGSRSDTAASSRGDTTTSDDVTRQPLPNQTQTQDNRPSENATPSGVSRFDIASSQRDRASSQRDLSSIPGFGNVTRTRETGATGSAMPNMIGDSTSIPTRKLEYRYWTWQNLPGRSASLDKWVSIEDYYDAMLNDKWFKDNIGCTRDEYLNANNYRDFESLYTQIENGMSLQITTPDGVQDVELLPYPWEEVLHAEPIMMSSTPSMYLTALNMAENFNAEVQDRVYFDLRFFGGAQGFGSRKMNDDGVSTADLARATMGFEKTFLQKRCSLELRIPVIMTMNSNAVDERIIGSTQGNQVGNISVIFKHVFQKGHSFTLSRGIGINLPTAPGIHMTYAHSRDNVVEGFIDNAKVSFVPFIGGSWQSQDSQSFGHGVAQLDVAVGKNRMRFYDTTWNGTRDEYRTALHESILARFNFGGGRWLIDWQDEDSRFKFGVMAECHYTANVDKLGSRNIGGRVSDNKNQFSATATKGTWQMIDLVFGLPMQTRRTAFMPFITTPITSTRYFDVEGGFTFDVRF